MTEEAAGVEVELFGIKATLPPGSEPFTDGEKLAWCHRPIAEYSSWHPLVSEGFARIMRDLWADERDRLYMNGPDDFEPKAYHLACRRKGAWNQIVKAAAVAGKGEGDD